MNWKRIAVWGAVGGALGLFVTSAINNYQTSQRWGHWRYR